jgi:hypothetical protein
MKMPTVDDTVRITTTCNQRVMSESTVRMEERLIDLVNN